MEGTVLVLTPLDREPIRLQVSEGKYLVPGPDAIVELDLSGYWAFPGLADCHAHLAVDSLLQVGEVGNLEDIRRRAFVQLAAGVFLVLDKGWRSEAVLSLLADPETERPHLEAAGRIIAGPEGYWPGFAVETDEAGLVEAVRAANTRGGWIKVVGDWPQKGKGPVVNFGEEALAAATKVAHGAGVRIAIHAMAPETPTLAVRAGVDSIEHGLYLTKSDVEMLGARGGCWVPTIGNTLDVIKGFGQGSTGARVLGKGLENIRALLPVAVEAGVVILAGTDLGLPHGEVAREAELLREYGLSGPATVNAASSAAYQYLGIGQLEPGASADVLLFDSDPRVDVSVLRRPVAGLRAGKVVFDRAGLFPADS
jgi:imidazolonepropionase-like amidohydrolase